LEATSIFELKFNLANMEVNKEADGTFSLHVPGFSQLEVAGEPDLPIVRTSVLLPCGATGQVQAILQDAKTSTVPISEWGAGITASKGKCSLCSPCNITAPRKAAYTGVYPNIPAVLSGPVETWRDVQFVPVEVQPVSVDHDKGVVTVLHSGAIKLQGVTVDSLASQPLTVEPSFYEAYKFFFANWDDLAHEYQANDQMVVSWSFMTVPFNPRPRHTRIWCNRG
jgi:hypothetical protein